MKNLLYKSLLALLFSIPFSAAQAQIPGAATVFDAATGKLKVVSMLFGGKSYYLEMSMIDAAALTMKIDASSFAEITQDARTVGKVATDLVGTWKMQGEETTLQLNANGTFRVVQAARTGPDACKAGDETGTFRYSTFNGVFQPTFLTDENGDCGLSGGGLIRIFIDGNTISVYFASDNESATLVRVN